MTNSTSVYRVESMPGGMIRISGPGIQSRPLPADDARPQYESLAVLLTIAYAEGVKAERAAAEAFRQKLGNPA